MDINAVNNIIWNIDEEKGILDYRLPNGLCLWLMVRYRVYTLLFKKSIKKYQVDTNPNYNLKKTKRSSLNSLISYWSKSFGRNPLVIKKGFDCLNICSSIACYPTQKGYRNRMTGFLNDFKDLRTLNVIRSNSGIYRENYEGSYCFYDSILLKEKIRKRLINNKPQQWNGFSSLLNEKLSPFLSTAEVGEIDNLIRLYSVEYKGMEVSFRKLLGQTKPKLVLIEDANYGSLDTCTLIMVAKDLGIKTAEVQHGVFDIGFQYSRTLLENPLLAFHKTDYILTFGDYFSQFIRSSSKNISLGNQFLEDQKNSLSSPKESRDSLKILFVTQKEFTDRLIPIVYTALKNTTTKFQLVIRLHPSESNQPLKYQQFQEFTDTIFSISDNVYEQIISSDVIIGSYSTLLTESIYFDKQPLIHKNDLSDRFIPQGIGMRFSNSDELVEQLATMVGFKTKKEKEYYWKSGCKENFTRFYKDEISNACIVDKEEPIKENAR